MRPARGRIGMDGERQQCEACRQQQSAWIVEPAVDPVFSP
jgi:hypothetical protein